MAATPFDDGHITLENVEIIFRNFEGREQRFNDAGDRNFCILLSPEQAEELAKGGWNVKTTTEKELDEGEKTGGEPYLPVKVSFKQRKPPRIVLITSRGRTDLDESTCQLVDFSDIVKCDVMVRPYDWEVQGKSGRKAYLRSIYVTIFEDELELKYADVKIASSLLPEDDHAENPYD